MNTLWGYVKLSYQQYGAWTANTAFLNVQNGIQVWTVPATGVYR